MENEKEGGGGGKCVEKQEEKRAGVCSAGAGQ